MPHETISIRENGSYHDADNQKSKNTAMPAQEIQSCVQGIAAPYTARAASITVTMTSITVTVGSLIFYMNV
ncbi:MAG: hypothetical protein QW395_06325, partial [Candidatus Nitrosotenuis sp.]